MEFFDKFAKKATETYKGAAEKTGKLAKEAKLRLKISENKSKINTIYKEIGEKVYQKHISEGSVCIKGNIEEECAKIDDLAKEIEEWNNEIIELSDSKLCSNCKETIEKEAKFCSKCGAEQPEVETKEAEVVNENNDEADNQSVKEAVEEVKKVEKNKGKAKETEITNETAE